MENHESKPSRRVMGIKLIVAGAILLVLAVVIFLVSRGEEGQQGVDPVEATSSILGRITSLVVALTGFVTAVAGFLKVLRPKSKGKHAE